MGKFFKKNWLIILPWGILAAMLVFVVPLQERLYLAPGIEEAKAKSGSVMLWTEIIFSSFLFFYLILNKSKSLENFMWIFFTTAGFAASYFFLFNTIFLSTVFFINGLSAKEIKDEKYIVAYADNSIKNYTLWNAGTLTSLSYRKKDLVPKEFTNMQVKDTVVISFSKGVLGINYNPHYKVCRYASIAMNLFFSSKKYK